MSPTHPQFARFLTKHRKACGLSKSELAREVGVHRSNVTFWEYGKVLPKVNVLERLARALHVSYEDLFAMAGYANPEGLPDPKPYLRAKYPGLSKRAITEAEKFFDDFEDRHGVGGDHSDA
jgi:transcriptional regulator with XRE-family HTH domain